MASLSVGFRFNKLDGTGRISCVMLASLTGSVLAGPGDGTLT